MKNEPSSQNVKRGLSLLEVSQILEAIKLQGSLSSLKMRVQVSELGLPILCLVMFPIPINQGPLSSNKQENEIAVNLMTSMSHEDFESPEAVKAVAAYSMFISVLHEFMEAFTWENTRPLDPHAKKPGNRDLLVEIQDAAKVLFRKHKHAFK